MESFIKIAQFIVSLSILVFCHEMGHFLFAKLFKTKVEKFYLFFNPWFTIYKKKIGETEFGIGWLPLGGYCKIAGMIDESMDKEAMKKEPQPWEYRSKPTWQRMFIILGGVLVNFFLAIFIYAMLMFHWGDSYLPNQNLTDGIFVTDSIAYEIGIENGDKILEINGEEQNVSYLDMMNNLLLSDSVLVQRGAEQKMLYIPTDLLGQITERKERAMMVYPRIPFIVAGMSESSLNAKSGLKEKDQLVSFAGQKVDFYDQFSSISKAYTNETVEAVVLREGKKIPLNLKVSEEGKIEVTTGFISFSDMKKMGVYEFEEISYSFFAAFPAGWNKAIDKLGFYIAQFKKILNPQTGAYKGLGGFGTIGSLFPAVWEWQSFWEITAFLSVILAFMNILPIPALDGGHALFLLYEMITGRKPGDKFLERAQGIGMLLLLLLLFYANGMDLVRWLNGIF